MAFKDIPGNPNWEYDDNPPDPGGALSSLYATGTGGIRTNPRGEKIYMNCRHKRLHPTQASVPNEINKTYWDHFISFTYLLNNCVLFNDRIVTAKVNGATSSSTTLVIDNNSGNGFIVVGMVVTGTGISGTPTVITVTNQNNLVLSSAQTLSDNVDLTFTTTESITGSIKIGADGGKAGNHSANISTVDTSAAGPDGTGTREVNDITGSHSGLIAGYANTIAAETAFIGGGHDNTIATSATGAAILGGFDNEITGVGSAGMALGSNLKVQGANQVVVGRFNVGNSNSKFIVGSGFSNAN